ncbi:son RNA binding protein [Arctopsyche grandis]|uniref:son RNA binding protein n=1 Tax=Arctopsyche grandis TaxID=121162 RepID=UPI00406D65E0
MALAELSNASEIKLKKETLAATEVTKSSTEILSELFGVFNARPPTISDEIIIIDPTKKKKKSKKKSKHKKKKKKKSQKKGRSSSDVSESESDSEQVKKKSKKSKHKKRKRRKSVRDSEGSSGENVILEEGETKSKRKKSSVNSVESDLQVKEEALNDDSKKSYEANGMAEIPIPKMPDISQIKLPEEKSKSGSKNVTDSSLDKGKNSNKIQIKNLKFSSVFEANVKQAEEEARKKAEKYEDGELTDSSSSSSSESAVIITETDSEAEKKKSIDLRDLLSKSTEKTERKSSGHNSENGEKYPTKVISEKSSRKSRSRSKSKSDKKSHRKSRSRSHKRSRSKSRSRDKSDSRRSGSRHRSKSRHYHDKYDETRYRRHDRHRSKEKDRIEIDKKRLLEIARKNAITMLQTGNLPAAANLGVQAQQKVITAIKCGGKSVDELTDFCKNLSRQEAIGELSSVTSGSDGEGDAADTLTKPFNNPFQLKDRAPIVLNIKGGTPLPTQSFQEKTIEQTKVLRQQFPVSSGSQHRGAENEWRPVSPPTVALPVTNNIPKPFQNADNSASGTPVKPATPVETKTPHANPVPLPIEHAILSTMPGMIQAINIPAVPPGPQVFPTDVTPPTMDIGSIVSQRLTAIRRLQQNPNDAVAMNQITQANQEMSRWAQSKQEPGQFTGSTGAQILTPKELASGYQAWARRDQLQTAAPVSSGMGMHLLQKMGWKPGEGLGKQKNGTLTPLLLEVKLDTRGLVAKEETRQRNNMKRPFVPTVKTLSGKHPVSLLGEYCSKRKLGVPSYTLCFECGPDHKKNFLFKVTVNGVEYQPSVASANKKQAKADAATVCLQKLGIIP